MLEIKTERRWKLTKYLVGAITVFFLGMVGLAAIGVVIKDLVIAYATFVTFATGVVMTNLATPVGGLNGIDSKDV